MNDGNGGKKKLELKQIWMIREIFLKLLMKKKKPDFMCELVHALL